MKRLWQVIIFLGFLLNSHDLESQIQDTFYVDNFGTNNTIFLNQDGTFKFQAKGRKGMGGNPDCNKVIIDGNYKIIKKIGIRFIPKELSKLEYNNILSNEELIYNRANQSQNWLKNIGFEPYLNFIQSNEQDLLLPTFYQLIILANAINKHNGRADILDNILRNNKGLQTLYVDKDIKNHYP